MAPTTIGPFRVLRPLGRGGMGEVYLAHDSRLNRRVAIKALPAELASNPDRLARFRREAKVLASLNHPGVGAIYGLEETAGHQYLILEFVEGETLAERLTRGAIPIQESLPIARQMAEALEAAHDKGVIHRDLKPGNVMVTPEGATKVLDFGLARADDNPSSGSHTPLAPDSPTLTSPASPTLAGVALGSPGYMSPEQALGKSVDKRSDIFAFGCVLYEMLTGERAFPGENAAAALGAVLHVEPDASALPDRTPARIRELLSSALNKDRRQRLHDIGDARLALERAIQGREWTQPAAAAAPATRPMLARRLPWALTAGACVLGAASFWRAGTAGPREPGPPRPTIRVRVDDASAPVAVSAENGGLAISPDGRQVAYLRDGRPAVGGRLTLRRLDAFAPDLLEVSTTDVFYSPDGKRVAAIGYGGAAAIDGSDVYAVPVDGGEPARLYRGRDGVAMKGGAWGPQGIIICPAPNAGLLLISEKGDDPRPLTVPDPARDEVSHRWPDMLPDGHRLLMTVKKADILTFDDAEIALLDLDTGEWRTIIKGGSYARYVPTGHIVFARNASIMAVPFDAASGEVTGTPVAVVSGVMTTPGSGAAKFAIARDSGTLAYIPGGIDEQRLELLWLDTQGNIEPVGAPIMPYFTLCPSPDGSRIATSVFGASDAVFVYDLARRTNTRVTFRGNCSNAGWLEGGTKLAYASDAEGRSCLFVTSADGSGKPEKVLDKGVRQTHWITAVQGQAAAVYVEAGDIYLQRFGATERQLLVGSQFDESEPRVSPDGKWLSYSSNESGQAEVYVRPFPSGEGRWQVSRGGGRFSCWAADSSVIYCTDFKAGLMRVSFRSGPPVEVGSPELLLKLPAGLQAGLEPHADGKRFLTARNLPPRFVPDQVCVVLNWFDELKAKVPVGTR